MTLHTTNGCSVSVKRKQTGKVLATNCYNGNGSNAGCGIQGAPNTYGQALNSKGGGVRYLFPPLIFLPLHYLLTTSQRFMLWDSAP